MRSPTVSHLGWQHRSVPSSNAKRSARRPLAAGNHLPLHMRVSA